MPIVSFQQNRKFRTKRIVRQEPGENSAARINATANARASSS
jgi:hypothetical protein